MFTKQESKLVSYVAGRVKSTVDYVMARQEDKAKVLNVRQGYFKRGMCAKSQIVSSAHVQVYLRCD